MRSCGECTLCCKIPKIPPINKPSNQWCMYCAIGEGCAIYTQRPKVCVEFNCHWLISDMPDEARPDRIGLYVLVKSEIVEVHVDAARPNAWQEGGGAVVVEELRAGRNVIVKMDNQVTFLRGRDCNVPEKLVLEWIL